MAVTGKPEVGLRAGHHELEVVGREAGGLEVVQGTSGHAAVLDASTTALLDLHAQLQIEVPSLFAAVDDVVIALWLALEGLAYHQAVFDAPDAGVGIPAGEAFAVEELFEAGMFVEVVVSGLMKFGHADELLSLRAGLGRASGRGFESGRDGLSGRECRQCEAKNEGRQKGGKNQAGAAAGRCGHGV